LVTLNMEERKVEVNEDALGRLEKRLKELGAQRVAIVSVMGAFRTGKSFILDLMLRFLRYEADHPEEAEAAQNAEVPARGGDAEFPLPAWMASAGVTLEGATDDSDGFRFKGGMDACTEGVWIWSEPFIRKLNGVPVAVLLMDTQGAWDSNMTKEQSATIFGLTAVLSSKLIYNINMQIQEDKVENLAYFMRFAQAAIRKASSELERSGQKLNKDDIDRPFQALDFLVRDWRHFREDWNVDQCKDQMEQHLARHVNPQNTIENSTAEALHGMFQRLKCFCLPHPGLAIERETWTGKVSDINHDFIRFTDLYVREVFTDALKPKNILGSELSTVTFPLVLRDFVSAFHDAAPAAMSFTQAMTNCTVLLAKETAMKNYTKKMDEAMEMEAEAERRRRAEVLQSEGDRQSEVNLAQGKMQSAQLQAKGEAEAIRERARATAEGIRLLSSAISESKAGDKAVALRVAEQYVAAWKEMARKSNTIIVPANPSDASGMVATAMSIFKQVGGGIESYGSSDIPSADGRNASPGDAMPSETDDGDSAEQRSSSS
ncbi:unnamed protein product, partial [Polarella glacialis]